MTLDFAARPAMTRDRYLVSPFFARVLFVVAAAIRAATLPERPRADSLRLMCSYCRLRFALFTPRGGMRAPPLRIASSAWTAKSGPRDRFVSTLCPVRAALLAALLFANAACAPAGAPRDTPSSVPVALPTAPLEPGLPTPTP